MEAEGQVYHNGFNYDPTASGDARLHELKCVCERERKSKQEKKAPKSF